MPEFTVSNSQSITSNIIIPQQNPYCVALCNGDIVLRFYEGNYLDVEIKPELSCSDAAREFVKVLSKMRYW